MNRIAASTGEKQQNWKELTKHEVIEPWKPVGSLKLYNKSVTLKIVGKTGVIYTVHSGLLRYYVTNEEKTYRLVVWRDQWNYVNEKFRLGFVIRFKNLQVGKLFNSPSYAEAQSTGAVWEHGEFIYTRESKFEVIEDKPLELYSQKYSFPPFWRELSKVQTGDSELILKLLLLSDPAEVPYTGDKGLKRVKVLAGDSKGKQANLYVNYDSTNESELILDLKKEGTVIAGPVKFVEDEGHVAIEADSPEYVFPTNENTMTRKGNYEWVKLTPATDKSKTKGIKRRSFY